MQADEVDGDWNAGGDIHAEGHVSLVGSGITLHAGSLSVAVATETIRASGGVQLEYTSGILHADELEYSKLGVSSGSNLVGRIQGFSVRAARFTLEPPAKPGHGPVLTLFDGAITSCTFDHPEYLVSARQIRLIPGESLEARGVAISILGLKLPAIPRLTRNLAKRTSPTGAGSALPTLGISNAYGPYIEWGFDSALGHGANVRWDLTGTRRLGLAGGLRLQRFLPGPLELSVLHADPIPRARDSKLTIDRLPQLRYPFGAERQLLGGNFTVVGDASAGYYREGDTRVSAGRMLLRAAGIWGASTGETHPVWGLGLSQSVYSGSEYTTAGALGGYQIHLSDEVVGGAALGLSGARGRTPFLFDRLEAPRQFQIQLASNNPDWSWKVNATYDLGARKLYDSEVTVAHLVGCVKPSVTYRMRDRQFMFGITIPALEGGAAPKKPPAPAARPSPAAYSWFDGDVLPRGPW